MIHRLVNLGVTDTLKIEEAQLVRLSNVLGLYPIPIYLFYIGYGFFFDQIFSTIVSSSMILLTVVSLYQNSRHRYGTAKVVLIWLNCFSIWITFNVFNVDYSVLSSFLPILLCYAFFFDTRTERKELLISLGFTTFFILSSFIIPRQLVYGINVPPDQVDFSNLMHLLFSFIITILLVYALFRYTKITSNKLIGAREEAEKYSKLQSDFLANMSHEIRTPLNGIIGSSYLLRDTDLTQEQKEYAETIGLSSGMLMEIIDNVLDLSKLEADKLDLEQSDFDLQHTLRGVAKMLKPTLKNKPVELKVEMTDDCGRYVKGDQKRIRQVISNLVGNAIKFTDAGEITLGLDYKMSKEDAYDFEIIVRDTGIGISAADQEKLFTRFYQVESSADRRFMGTGLGLVISRNLIELMGGTLSVESTLGKGTEFKVAITLGISKNTKKVTNKSVIPIGQRFPDLKILVAEDNEVNQIVMKKLLSKMGFEIDIACNGDEAFEMAISGDYDLIFMDIQMPGKDGMQATRDIRRRLKNLEVPVIAALTANALMEDKELCLKAGMNDYLSKPVTANEITKLMETWFEAVPEYEVGEFR